MRLKSALRRGVAAAVIAGIVVSSGIPAYAARWDIADGDITVRADEAEGTNRVSQGKNVDVKDTDTVITGKSEEHTVTIDTSKGNVDVTFDDLKIDVSGKAEVDGSGKAEGDVSDKTEVDGSDKAEVDGGGDSPVRESNAAVTVKGDHDATIELDGKNELKSGSKNAGLEKNDERSEDGKTISGKLTIKDDKGKDGSLTAAGGAGGGAGIGGKHESGAGNIEITGGTIKAEGGEGAAGIGGGVYGIGHDIEISGGKVSATGGNANKNLESFRTGAAGIGDGAGTEKDEIDPNAPSNPNHIYISGDAEVEAKAGASTGGKTAAIGGGDVGEIPNSALSDDHHKVTGGSLTRYDPAGKKMEDYSYDRRTPSQPEQPDDTENNDDEDDTPSVQVGEVPDRVKQMYETVGVITHPDGTQELGNVATAEYDPVNKVLSFDAHGTLFRMTGDSLRELAKEVHELRIRFLDGEGREMEAVIPLARIKDLVGVNGAFELELSQEGLYRFYVVGQTGYDRKTFSDETVLRQSGKELILVYRVGDEEQKAQETARVEEAIARRKQEKKQWGTVLSGLEGGSLSGLPELTQPGTGTVGDLSGLTTLSPDSLTTAQQPKQPASDQTVWKTFTGNIVKLVGGKQDSKKDDPAPSVGDLSGPPTLSPDSLTTAQQPETSGQPSETSAQQPEARGWVKDSQGKWVWLSGQESGQEPNWKPDKWVTLHDYDSFSPDSLTTVQQPEARGWVKDSQGDWVWKPGKDDSQPPDWGGDWKIRKWIRVSQSPDLAWWNSFYDSVREYDYEG